MRIKKATQNYEAWLGGHLRIVKADLELKHREMAADTFRFLRATFYRWCQLWPEVCPEQSRAPRVLAVGDLHVENFGTWRDIEGRLVWGINDFDEACTFPYTIDLVRLATSAHFAIASDHLRIGVKDACQSILEGYQAGLTRGGSPIVLGESHHWLRTVATSEAHDPARYWERMDALPTFKGRVPKSAVRALKQLMPEKGLHYRVAHRVAGLGSLGRERFMALADWRGGKLAREAKALAPSAYHWAGKGRAARGIRYEDVLTRSVRSRDPFVHLKGRWIVRRLAPDCTKVELSSLPKERDESRLLYEMGFETANVHLGSRTAVKSVLRDLRSRGTLWLHQAAAAMAKATLEDWDDWRSH
ncbi:MAG TPA: DUF2252 family protein [Terriglobia bacterium]|nr:DUF2252 family protein [Terriglobia bacterium]